MFLFRVPYPGPHQYAFPDMIFWLTSAFNLNHVLSALQTNCDLSIGDTASAMFGPRIIAERIDRYKADLSCCVPAPSFRRCDRPQLDRQDEACFHLLSHALLSLASPLPISKCLRTPQRSQAIMLRDYQLHSSGYADATCDPLVLYSPASCPLSAWKRIRRYSPESITHP